MRRLRLRDIVWLIWRPIVRKWWHCDSRPVYLGFTVLTFMVQQLSIVRAPTTQGAAEDWREDTWGSSRAGHKESAQERIDTGFCFWGNFIRAYRLANLNGLAYSMILKNGWCPSGLNLANCKLGETQWLKWVIPAKWWANKTFYKKEFIKRIFRFHLFIKSGNKN